MVLMIVLLDMLEVNEVVVYLADGLLFNMYWMHNIRSVIYMIIRRVYLDQNAIYHIQRETAIRGSRWMWVRVRWHGRTTSLDRRLPTSPDSLHTRTLNGIPGDFSDPASQAQGSRERW